VQGGFGDVVILARGMRSGVRPLTSSPACVLALGPTLNQQVLSPGTNFHPTPLPIPPGADTLERFYSGILFMHGDRHKKHRRLIAPAFHPTRLEGYSKMIAASAERRLQNWKPGDTVDILKEGRDILIGFMTQMLIGKTSVHDHSVSVGERMEDVKNRSLSLLAWLPMMVPGSPRRELITRARSLYEDLEAIIAKKRASTEDDGDLLTPLIHAHDDDGTAMTAEELIGQLFLLFIGGFESAMTALTWTCYLLAQHPEVAADLHDELTGTLHGNAPTLAQLEKLPLLEAVIKESLRVLPPVFALGRVTAGPVEMGKHRLPPDTEIFLSVYHSQRQPDLYEHPARFLPKRWETINPSSFNYLPFGAGPHTCIGWGLAMIELKIILSVIVQRYRLALPNNVRIDRKIFTVLGPKPGTRMIVHPQDRQFAASRATVHGHFAEMVDLRQ
jgi:cytochrome P450